MLKILFSSSARVKILTLFMMNPRDRFYQRQISEFTDLPIRAVQREVEKLQKLGLLERDADGNRVYYQVNRKFALFPELKSMVLKTTGLGLALHGLLENEDKVQVAFVYGSYAADEEVTASDVDLFVIGELSSKELSVALSQARRSSQREINYTLFAPDEFSEKAHRRNNFLMSVLQGPKVFLKGDEDALQQLAAARENTT